MFSDLQPKAYLTVYYIINRIPTKRYVQKKNFEFFIKSISSIVYLYSFNYQAYLFIYNILRLQKMSPRAQISYLTNYDSTNIYRIQIPISNKVIRIKDIKFNDVLFYDPFDLIFSVLRIIKVKIVMNILEILDKSEEQE